MKDNCKQFILAFVHMVLGAVLVFQIGLSAGAIEFKEPMTKLPIAVTDSIKEQIYTTLPLPNACYINATGYKDALAVHEQKTGDKHFARIMYVKVVKVEGHAVCVFTYDGLWHVYDVNKGTVNLGKWNEMPTPEQVCERLDYRYLSPSWYP